MPKVGNKTFPYTAKGKAAAKKAAAKSGMKVSAGKAAPKKRSQTRVNNMDY
jgi:hypothetical protein